MCTRDNLHTLIQMFWDKQVVVTKVVGDLDGHS